MYLIEHCMSVRSEKKRFESFQVYTTDCLNVIARRLGAKISKRYYELLYPPRIEPHSAKDIVDGLVDKIGLKVVKKSNGIHEPDGDDRSGASAVQT